VTSTLLRLRPLLIGLVVLLFTAGIAFAAKPDGPAPGRAIAAEHAGKIVPVQAEENADEEEPAEEEPAEEEETEQSEEAGENCTTDPSELTAEELAEVRHGSVVCWAAHQETPEGFDNHGAWVSEWAKKNNGHDFGAVDDAGTVLPAAASEKGQGKSKNH
jgi:hypothetical protein